MTKLYFIQIPSNYFILITLSDQSVAEMVVEIRCFRTYSLISTDNGVYRFYGIIWKRVNENNIITPTNFTNVYNYYIQCLNFLWPTIDEKKYFTLFSSVNGKASYNNVVFVAVKPDGSTLYFRPDTTHDNYYRVRRLVMTWFFYFY